MVEGMTAEQRDEVDAAMLGTNRRERADRMTIVATMGGDLIQEKKKVKVTI